MLDNIDKAILLCLQQDARTPYSKLGRKVGLTGPAVSERVRRLEEMKVITGYHATINHAAVGYPISAVMEVTYPSSHAQRMYSLARRLPEIIECCHLTGNSSVVLRVVARSVQHLETLMKAVQAVGTTQTSVILSTPVSKRIFSVG
jgi:Lrp/AsnC family transcriptional regulator, leucine-responsive regulatory protein